MTAVDTRPVEIDAQWKEQQLRLIASLPADIHVSDWSLGYNRIDALTGEGTKSDAERREMLRRVAEMFGLEYGERDHGAGRNIVTASGFISGVHVRFWRLVSQCSCDCGKAVAA